MKYKIHREVYKRLSDEERSYPPNIFFIQIFENEGVRIEYFNSLETKKFISMLYPERACPIDRSPFLFPVKDEVFKEIDNDYLFSIKTDSIKIEGKEYAIKSTTIDIENNCVDIYTNDCRFIEDKESQKEATLISNKLKEYKKQLNEGVEKINKEHEEFKRNKKPWEFWKRFDLSPRLFRMKGGQVDIIKICCE